MSKNIFDIGQEYLDIMNEIEECEGVLTPELEAKLSISQDELEKKLKAYHHIIQSNKSDILTCEAEIERLTSTKLVKQNIIDKLRERILQATLLYGETGKSGNKKLKFDTIQTYTTNRDSINIDEIELIKINQVLKELAEIRNIYGVGSPNEAECLRKYCETEEQAIILINALENFDFTINIKSNLQNILPLNAKFNIDYSFDTNKTKLKEQLEKGTLLPCVTINTKPSITIK